MPDHQSEINPLGAPTALPFLINSVHQALTSLEQETPPPAEPAVPLRTSVTPGYIACLDDGKKLKMLKRHLNSAYNMSPDEYRQKWGLPLDYPMVAPKYAVLRSELAKKIGLGKKRKWTARVRRTVRK